LRARDGIAETGAPFDERIQRLPTLHHVDAHRHDEGLRFEDEYFARAQPVGRLELEGDRGRLHARVNRRALHAGGFVQRVVQLNGRGGIIHAQRECTRQLWRERLGNQIERPPLIVFVFLEDPVRQPRPAVGKDRAHLLRLDRDLALCGIANNRRRRRRGQNRPRCRAVAGREDPVARECAGIRSGNPTTGGNAGLRYR
jgi:hypothetical protein